MRNNNKNRMAALLLVLSLLGAVLSGCKQPSKKSGGNTNKPPHTVWDDIDAMDQTLADFKTIYAKGDVFVELAKATGHNYTKAATVKFGRLGDKLYITGQGKITLPLNGIKEMSLVVTEGAWLHFKDNLGYNFNRLTIEADHSTVTSYNYYENHHFSVTANASTIEFYHQEPLESFFVHLTNNSRASFFRHKNYDTQYSLVIDQASVIDNTSTLKAASNEENFNQLLKTNLSAESYARVQYRKGDYESTPSYTFPY